MKSQTVLHSQSLDEQLKALLAEGHLYVRPFEDSSPAVSVSVDSSTAPAVLETPQVSPEVVAVPQTEEAVMPVPAPSPIPASHEKTAGKTEKKHQRHGGEHKPEHQRNVAPELAVSPQHQHGPASHARPKPPSGTITPKQLLTLSAYKLADVVKDILLRGEHPQVVLYTSTKSGYDLLRIAVMIDWRDEKGAGSKAFLCVTSATGCYQEVFGRMVNEEVRPADLIGTHEIKNPHREARAKALHKALTEVVERIKAAAAYKTAKHQ